jgi:hypothetical protein
MRIPVAAISASLALAVNIVIGSVACAEAIKYRIELKPENEVPPNSSHASGSGEARFDTETKILTWTITYSGLSGPAIGAHFHGPGEPGKNAGIVLPFLFVNSPLKGQQKLSDAQAAGLLAGRWYANIHTVQNPGGEIRGQLMREK